MRASQLATDEIGWNGCRTGKEISEPRRGAEMKKNGDPYLPYAESVLKR